MDLKSFVFMLFPMSWRAFCKYAGCFLTIRKKYLKMAFNKSDSLGSTRKQVLQAGGRSFREPSNEAFLIFPRIELL